MTQHMKKSTAVWVKTAAGTDSRRWSWLSATVHCTGSEMVKHVGTQVIPVENVLHSKRDGDKVLVDLGQTLHIG